MPACFETSLTNFLLGNFDASPPNDDTDLMLASLLALREHGTALTSSELADTWLKHVSGACTAELVALRNLQKGLRPPRNGPRRQSLTGDDRGPNARRDLGHARTPVWR